MNCEDGGLPGYRGFEYQIDASIWIALDLMLDKGRIDTMMVEPANAEDVEAALAPPAPAVATDPDLLTASVKVTVARGRRMLYQMKTRSTGPWTDSAFGSVVGDGIQPPKPARGPTPRARALKLLLDDGDAGYMLLTDAAVDSKLFRLDSATLHADASTAVPSKNLLDPSVQDRAGELSGRVHILSSLTSELLQFRIEKLLTGIGKVPHVQVARCIEALKEGFRKRLLGTESAWFERVELLQILRAHDGVADSQEDPCYVAPADLVEVEARLDSSGLIVLVGPPGAGKTMLAGNLAARHRKGTPPFRVVWEHVSLGNISDHVNSDGPTLVIVGDLWGTSTYTGDSTFAHDLFRFIDSASRDKRFIITARNDIYAKVPAQVKERLTAHVIEFSDKNYGDDKLWAIATQAADLTGEQLAALAPLRAEILARLRLPAALRKFASLLKKGAFRLLLPAAPDDGNTTTHNAGLVDRWLREAEDATHGTRIRNQLEQWSGDLGEHAVLLWLLSEASESINIGHLRQLAGTIRRNTAVRLRAVEFVAFLQKNDLASVSGNEVRIHSLVLEKMAMIVRERPSLADEFAIDFLSIILRSTSDEGILGRMERIVGVIRTLYSEPEAQADGWDKLVGEFDRMIAEACSADDPNMFRQAVSTGMWLPWTHSAFVKLLHSLGPGESDITPAWYGFTPTPEFIAEVRKSSHVDTFLPRFVAEFVPFTNVWYAYEPGEFADCMQRFGLPLEDAARAGLQAMASAACEPAPENDWRWDQDHNAPALLDLLPAAEQLAAGQQLGWKPAAPSAEHASGTHSGTRRVFIRG
ncbi:nSTAND3 domain-containing NTPase (plasmid) [Paraburkholderia strydomiana]